MLDVNKIYCGNNVELIRKLDDDCIDLTVTSPPYDNLRDYNGYDWDFEELAHGLFRVTKNGGVVVWIVGDATIKGSETGNSFKQALSFMDCGFKLHDTMIYEKNNFSNPSCNRYHQIFEYMFVFVKNNLETFNPIKDRKNIYAGTTCWGKNTVRQVGGDFKERPKKVYSEYGMRHNIWRYITSKGFSTKDSIAHKHPAIFPEKLAEDHIISWSNENDLILDPFMGSGTTAKMALKNQRNFIGFEISREYVDLANQRIKPWIEHAMLF